MITAWMKTHRLLVVYIFTALAFLLLAGLLEDQERGLRLVVHNQRIIRFNECEERNADNRRFNELIDQQIHNTQVATTLNVITKAQRIKSYEALKASMPSCG